MSTPARLRSALLATTLVGAAAAATLGAVPSASAAPSPGGGSMVPIAPVRVLDSRSSSPGGLTGGMLHPELAFPDVSPSDVTAVLINVTVVNAASAGWIRLGDGTGTSNGNFVAQAPSATLALVPLQHNDDVANFVSFQASTTISLTADVQGYVTSSATAPTSTFTAITPKRVADSRTGTGLHALAPNQTQTLAVRSGAALPANATAVIANVTVVKPTTQTYVTAWGGGTRPTASTVNATGGNTVANRVVVPLDSAGRISLYNYAGQGNVLVDVVGYLSPDVTGSYYVPATVAQRLTDHSGERITLTPDTPGATSLDTTAVWVNLAGVGQTGGYLTSGPTVTLPAKTSDLNTVTGRAVSNSGPVALTPTGSFSVASAPTSRFVVDLAGWFQKAGA